MEAHTEGTRESLLWIWEELGNLHRVDIQLLGQLCSLGLEMGVLREELVAFLEEEDETLKEEEEDEEPEGKQEEGHLGVSCPVPGYHLPDFEITI
ncbi:glutamate-rich protein 4 isoform X2 [Artibeus jamaicensis]|uniref:glutamate-rich protein 4 isoform X2 n=1 Tax=Artibeus jamaicensis TaxID=9417 RepID=UPI00235AF7B5|nr:glutamate-rich protein 4 isoform X2 [Artibeus jamaicensis]